ncbi:MAG: hypothetical protein ABIH00_07320 [Armatimonadota bacterium]
MDIYNINNLSFNEVYTSNIISYSKEDKKNVLRDLEGRITTLKTIEEEEPNSDAFIEKVILPPFLDLYKRWKDGYNLLMKSDFEIGIIKFKDDDFFKEDKSEYERAAASCTPEYPDRILILLNRYDAFSHSSLKEAVSHEIMHAIDGLILKDAGGEISALSGCLDKKYKKKGKKNGKLTQIALKYMNNLQKAHDEIYRNYKENHELNPESTKKIMNEYGCWSYKYTDKCYLDFEDMIDHFSYAPKNASEMLVSGLQMYFGTKEEKMRLKQMDPWLYGLIEKEVIPAAKKRLTVKPVAVYTLKGRKS